MQIKNIYIAQGVPFSLPDRSILVITVERAMIMGHPVQTKYPGMIISILCQEC